MRTEATITINRPVEEVFAYETDFDRVPEWQSGTLEMKMTSEGPLRAGATYRFVGQGLGKHIETHCEITEFEQNKKWCYKILSGPVAGTGCTSYEPVAGGTKITVVSETDLKGFFKLAEAVVARMARRQVEADLRNLKDILEAGA